MSTLAEMKARAAAAAEGPWQMSSFTQNGRRHFQIEQKRGPLTIARPYREEDAELIAGAPEDLEQLITLVEQVRDVKPYAEQDRAAVVTSGYAEGYDQALREIRAMIEDSLG